MNIEPLKNELKKTELPIYECIIKTARELIISGEWQGGERFPTDRVLAAELGINHITLAKALNELRRLGMISRRRSIGTFVNKLPQSTCNVTRIKKIGVVFDAADEHTFHKKFFLALYRELEQNGMSMQFFAADNSPEKQLHLLKQIVTDPAMDGCLFWSILERGQMEELMHCRPGNFPLVALDKYYADIPHDSVVFNNFECAVKIGQALRRQKIDKLYCYYAASDDYSSIKDRLEGVKSGAKCDTIIRCSTPEELNEIIASDEHSAVIFAAANTVSDYDKIKMPDSQICAAFVVDSVLEFNNRAIVCRFNSADLAQKAVAMLSGRMNGDDSVSLQYLSDGRIAEVKPI